MKPLDSCSRAGRTRIRTRPTFLERHFDPEGSTSSPRCSARQADACLDMLDHHRARFTARPSCSGIRGSIRSGTGAVQRDRQPPDARRGERRPVHSRTETAFLVECVVERRLPPSRAADRNVVEAGQRRADFIPRSPVEPLREVQQQPCLVRQPEAAAIVLSNLGIRRLQWPRPMMNLAGGCGSCGAVTPQKVPSVPGLFRRGSDRAVARGELRRTSRPCAAIAHRRGPTSTDIWRCTEGETAPARS
jgi:hypothetical protein